MANLKDLSKREEIFVGGHRLCAGCGAGTIMRMVMRAQELPVVAAISTGCVEVSSVLYPYSSWKCSYIHNAFENSAATMSGVETAYRALKKKGKIKEEIRFIAFGGDGGTYDIGLQSLSGAMERGHRMLYLCYNNEAYMNCLSADSLIMTKDGLRKITDIKEGDEVYAFNQKTYQLVSKKCTGVFDNGKKEVFELSTLHHSIKATANHPFLVAIRNSEDKSDKIICQTKTRIFVWKILEHIEIGDEVVVLKDIEQGFQYEEVISIRSMGIEPTLDLRVEGEHNFIADGIVVHNTGVQRSSATPRGASTTTTPPGAASSGKKEFMKDLTQIMVAHKIPYVAQASPSHWNDLVTKVQKALSIDGPSFINVLSPCPLGWRHADNVSIEMARIPVECCFWPLYEVENGRYKLNYKPEAIRPITDWLTPQGRFRHLNEPQNKYILDELQVQIKKDWEDLLVKCGEAPP